MHPVITLTGVVTEPEVGLSILVNYYFKSTDINLRSINEDALSFVKDLQEQNPASAIRSSLQTILRAHFDEADVSVVENDGEFTVTLEITDDSKTIRLEEVHESVPGILNKGEEIDDNV